MFESWKGVQSSAGDASDWKHEPSGGCKFFKCVMSGLLAAASPAVHAGTLPVPFWSMDAATSITKTAVSTDDGFADLHWSVAGSEPVEFFRLTEQFNGSTAIHFLDHPTAQLYRIEPGVYQFWVQACERDAAGYPNCGQKSTPLELTVNEEVAEQRSSSSTNRTQEPEPKRSPSGFTPGRWHNPERGGHGWSFFWKSRLSLSPTHPNYGDAWDLLGLWYTYEARLKYPENPDACPGPACIWLYEDYKPVYARFWLTKVSSQRYAGTVYIMRNGVQRNVGSIAVNFGPDDTSARLDWGANFLWQYLTGTDDIQILVLPDPDPADNPSHYSGLWESPAGQGYLVSHALGYTSESVEVVFEDEDGHPSWIMAAGDDPDPGHTDLCFFYVSQGFKPGTTGQLALHENGCDADLPAGPGNRNATRSFTGFEKEQLWLSIDLPGGSAPDGFNAGSSSFPHTLSKHASFHRVDYESPSGSSCQLATGSPPCTVSLTWFTDGHYPEASVFAHDTNGGSPVLIETAMVKEDFEWCLDDVGKWKFELRMGDTPDSSLMGVSRTFTVTGENSSACDGAGPETPPAPAAAPDMTPDLASSRTGATAGEFAVAPTGAANYRIPILAAPGSGGLAPSVSLAYDSQAANGPVGVGWGIDGFSVISRCAQTIEQDANPDLQRISFSRKDRFCLDGERLMALNGVYGANGTEYRKERDDYTRVVSYGSGIDGPSYFRAWSREGVLFEFGRTADSRIETRVTGIEDVAYAWAQNRVEDTAGNYMEYRYSERQQGPVDFVLEKIRYTGNSSAGTQPYGELIFVYAQGRSDAQLSYIAGTPAAHSRLLERVDSLARTEAAAPMQFLRSYHLGYGIDGWGRAVLESVTECRDASTFICFAPTVFAWQKSEHAVSASGPDASGLFTADFRGLAIGDSSGDGRPDLLITEQGGENFEFALATGSATGAFSLGPQRFALPESARTGAPVALTVIDLNADGFQDVLFLRETDGQVRWHARLAGPSGMGKESVVLDNCCGLLSPRLLQVLDFNGDGLSDIMTNRPVPIFEEASEIVVLINDFEPGDAQPSFRPPLVIDVNYRELFPSNTVGGWELADGAPIFGIQSGPHMPGRVEEFSGDGSADILIRLSRLYRYCDNLSCSLLGTGDTETPSNSVFIIPDEGGSTRASSPDPTIPAPPETWGQVTFYVAFFADQDGQYSTYEIIAKGAGEECAVPDVCNPHLTLPEVKRTLAVDINADGLADVAYLDEEYDWHYRLNAGAGFLPPKTAGSPPDDQRAELARFIDITGDGYPELLYPSLLGNDAAVWMVQYNDLGQGFSAPLPSSMPVGNTLQGDNGVLLDFTGDGIVDQLVIDWRADGNGAQAGSTRLRRGVNSITGQTGQAVNAITAITDGFGARTRIAYSPLTDPNVHSRMRDSVSVHWGRGSVIYDLPVPFYAVTTVDTSAPVYGGPSRTERQLYHYVGAKLQAGGRGFLGFAEIVEFDPETNLRTNVRYRQDFPFTGLQADSGLFLSNYTNRFDSITDISSETPHKWPTIGAMTPVPAQTAHGTLIRYKIHEWKAVEGSPGSGSWAVRSPAELDREYALEGQFKRKTLTTRSFDAFGNILMGEERRYDSDESSAWSRITTRNQWLNDQTRWRLGRLTSAEVTHWRSDADTDIVRRSSYAYHPQSSLLVRETAEPGHASRQVVTNYTLDAFGNRINTTVTGSGMAPRRSAAGYDALGRFTIETRNEYSQLTLQIPERDVFGNPLETRNIDGVASIAASDHMGRPFATYHETGHWSRRTLRFGSHPQCPSGTAYHSIETAGDTATSIGCFDRLGRKIRNATEGFLGSWIYTDSYFDASGRPERLSEPYFAGQTRYWNLTRYDALGRLTQTIAANGLVENHSYDLQAAHCGQSGPRAKLTRTFPGDGTVRNRWEAQNVAGETERVLDDNCGRIDYAYDGVGNLVEVIGIDGSVVTIDYDALGLHKIQMNDPDKGLWQYAGNALGEVTRQLDSKQQAIDFEYDLMGRVIHRRELTGIASLGDTVYQTVNHEIRIWQNSTAPGVTGRGQLVNERYLTGEAGAVVHERSYVYDGYGRIARIDHLLEGQMFSETNTYDQFGRLFQQFDASGNNHGTRYHYNARGYLDKVQEAREGEAGIVYQQILATDPRGNPTAMALGNKTEVFAEYDPTSGFVRSLEAYGAGGGEMQYFEYGFDRLGNLEWRHDRSGNNNLREDFAYDEFNRLERVLLTAPQFGLSQHPTQSMSYGASGNISYKSDVGGYSYGQGAAGPHAVTQAGSRTFSYDANGNQVSSSDGRNIAYSVFDKPTRIAKGSNLTEFSYGLGNRRYKRVDDNDVDQRKTTWSVGSVELIDEAGSEAYFKRYIGGVTIVDYYPASGRRDAWYLAKDHIGSIHSISDAAGNKVHESHFDPWGMRQRSDWQTPLTVNGATIANQFTTRGFTGHEHADGLGVIHMNGRIYDPRLGRFLQADPIVQSPKNGQSLNRYAYALNNPLSYTDPSGYFFERLIRKWGRVIAAAIVSFYLPGSQGWLATFFNVTSSFAQAAITGFVAGGITGGFRGAVKGAFIAAITWGADRVFNPLSDKDSILKLDDIAPDAEAMERLFGAGVKPESGLYRISVGTDGRFVDAVRIPKSGLATGDWIFTNGASNDFADAVRNGTTHVAQVNGAVRDYVLNFNQTATLGADLIQTAGDILGTYFGFGHTGLAKDLGGVVNAASENGVRGLRLIGHSQGAAITTSALRYAADAGLGLNAVASVHLHGAPINNLYAARSLSRRIGTQIVNRFQFADTVNAVVGANFITNPLRLPFSLIRSPHLFSGDASLSPHTTPCGSRVQLCP